MPRLSSLASLRHSNAPRASVGEATKADILPIVLIVGGALGTAVALTSFASTPRPNRSERTAWPPTPPVQGRPYARLPGASSSKVLPENRARLEAWQSSFEYDDFSSMGS